MTVIDTPSSCAPAETGTTQEVEPPRIPSATMMNVQSQLCSESIYDSIKPEEKPPAKEPRYVSKHARNTGDFYKADKQSNASLGPSKVPLREPKNFLKSHEKEMALPEKKAFEYQSPNKKPALPKTAPSYGVKSEKNFLVENPLEVIRSQPKKRGSKEPVYREKTDYGRAPAYLSRREAEQQAQAQVQTIKDTPIAPPDGRDDAFGKGAERTLARPQRKLGGCQ